MKNLTAEQANNIVQNNLKHNKNRAFNETGVHFGDDIWAFPNNRKIFIGVKDFPMSEKTYIKTMRAMIRYKVIQKTKNPYVATAIFVLLLGMALCGLSAYNIRYRLRNPGKSVVPQTDTTNKSLGQNFEHFR